MESLTVSQRRNLLTWSGIAAAMAAFVLATLGMRSALNGEPFQMIVRPVNGQAVVQFARPAQSLVSPEFPLAISVNSATVSVLRSKDAAIPIGKIEFHDVTILPGRFQIRIGESLFDVMQRAIIVDGREYDWQAH